MSLTRRQEEVVRLMADGLTNAEIGQRLGITLDGAKFHVSEVMNKLGANTREEAVAAWRVTRRRWAIATPLAWVAVAGLAAAASLVVVGIIQLVSSGTNDSSEPAGPLARVAEQSGDTTAAFSLRVQAALPNGTAVDLAGTGVVDFRRDEFALTLANGVEHRLVDGSSYQLLEGGPWRKLNSGSATTSGFRGSYWLELLQSAADAEELGQETVAGFVATHYRFSAPYPVPKAPPQHVVDMYRDSPRQLDVWVADGRPVKALQRVEKRNTGDPDQDGEVSVITIEWSDWGRKVDIQAPDPALVEE